MKNQFNTLLILFALLFVMACQKQDVGSNSGDLPNLGYYVYEFEESVPNAVYGAQQHNVGLTNAKAQLGRVIFYDRAMSVNNRVSCGSCHQQAMGFADGRPSSEGFLNENTQRHSMSLVNEMGQATYFWDARAFNLAEQVMMPVANHIEMGIYDTAILMGKLKALDYYKDLFAQAYGTEDITMKRTGDALASFVGSMASYNTKFDQVNRGEAGYTALEERGKEAFGQFNCGECHAGFNFNQSWGFFSGTTNIGLDNRYSEQFKIPTLRNIAVTAPYMHDGRFASLEEVLNHYDHGIQPNDSLDWRLRSAMDENSRMNMTADDKRALIAFLNTLTDEKMLNDPKYADPFK